MKYTKLFNNHSEYVAYTASTSFVIPNVSWCKQENESHCTPYVTCEEGHTYEIVGNPTYPQTVAASATSFNMSFNYNDTYINSQCQETITSSSDTVTIAIQENQGITSREISGTYTFHGINIPYSLIQEGIENVPYEQQYLTFDVQTGGTIIWVAQSGVTRTISYSKNNGVSWTNVTSTLEGAEIEVSAGDKLLIKGSNDQYSVNKDAGSSFSGGTARYNAEGNIMSLIGGDNFSGLTTFNGKAWVFHNLFKCSGVVSAENLILPVKNLTECCYRAMFVGASANERILIKAPKIIPAETMAVSACCYMFQYTRIATSPELPCSTLANYCYYRMFMTSSLNYIKCLATDISASNCTFEWASGVQSTGTFVKHPSMTNWTTGSTSGVPNGWTLIDASVATPTISCNGEFVTITCDTPNATIYYKLDSGNNFSAYTQPIEITADTVVTSYAESNGETSTTVTETCIYNPQHHYEYDYLTLDVLTGGTIMWVARNSVAKTISYSINNGEWTEITATAAGAPINVSSGDKVRLKGNNTTYATSKDTGSGFSGGTAYYNVEGNAMSLIDGDNFSGLTSFTDTYVFHNLFAQSLVVSAENMVLPVMTLTDCCYRAMFSKTTTLSKAPKLPATTLAVSAYTYMFDMTQITKAPDLPATALTNSCYLGMFENCTSLNYIKCLAASTSNSYTKNWVGNGKGAYGVSPTGTFVKNASANWSTSISGVPSGWTVVVDGTPDTPTISCDGFEVELSCATAGADIYYKLDNSGSYSAYTTAITLTADTFVEAYAVKNNLSSTTTSMTCIYDSRTIYEYSNETISSWTYSNNTVTVPYSVNAIDGHSSNYAKGTFNFETSVQLRDAEPTYLWFQHADQSASIYVDDTLVEKHWGGYASFFTDISNYVHKGTNNIKVALKNNEGNVLAPYTGDFNFNATLGVVKLFTSPYVPSMTYGYDGFHITSTVSTGTATIHVATNIPTGASVVCTISGTNCNYTATSASTGAEMIFTTTITNPHLWNGTSDPYLYNVKIEIYHDNVLYHRYERPYGLRFYEYVINQTVNGSTYTGFLLNGQPYLLRGCCMHDDIVGKANALNDADYTQQFNLITELGLNFLRLAHYPHPKEVYDWCDRLGIIVETEGPCVNNLETTMPEDYYTHLEWQYNDMVIQHYNHPCIVFWGLSNEAKVTNSDAGRTFAKAKIEAYTTQIKALDSERMVGLVGHALTDPLGYFGNPTNIDWIGSNLYQGWYQNQGSNNPTTSLNTCISNTITSASKAFAFSEYGAGGTQNCHSDSPTTTTNRGSGGARHDIEYQMWLHEGHIAAIKNKPELLFTSQWVLFDFAVSSRNEGYTLCPDGETTSTDDELRRLNDKGLVERDHVTKKDTFYLYKAWWNQTPFIHICGKDYTKKTSRTIKCYTNGNGTFTLYVNNTSVATATASNYIVEFTAQNFNNGDVITVGNGAINDTFTFS